MGLTICGCSLGNLSTLLPVGMRIFKQTCTAIEDRNFLHPYTSESDWPDKSPVYWLALQVVTSRDVSYWVKGHCPVV